MTDDRIKQKIEKLIWKKIKQTISQKKRGEQGDEVKDLAQAILTLIKKLVKEEELI